MAVSEERLLDQSPETPSPLFGTFEQYSPESYSGGHKRKKILSEGKETSSMFWITRLHAGTKFEEGKTSQVDFSDPFALPHCLEALDSGKYGSVTKDIEDLRARKMQLLNPLFARYPVVRRADLDTVGFRKAQPEEVCKSLNRKPIHSASASCDIIDLEEDCTATDVPVCEDSIPFHVHGVETTVFVPGSSSSIEKKQTNLPKYLQGHSDLPIVILDLDEEDGDRNSAKHASSSKHVTSNFEIPLGSQKNDLGDQEKGAAKMSDTTSLLHDVQCQQGNSELADAEVDQSDSAKHASSSKHVTSNFEIPLGSQKNDLGDQDKGAARMSDTTSLLHDVQCQQGNTELADAEVDQSDSAKHASSSKRVTSNFEIPLGSQKNDLGDQEKGAARMSDTTSLLHDVQCQQGNTELADAEVDQSDAVEANRNPSYQYQKVNLRKPVEEKLIGDLYVRECGEGNIPKGEEERSGGEKVYRKEQGVYVGGQDYTRIEKNEDDSIGDIWREMALALECSKDAAPASSAFSHSGGEEECNHSFILKDDLGYVCRVCGVIGTRIEMIYDFQWIKGTKTTKTYFSESQNSKGRQQTEVSPLSRIEESQEDLTLTEMSVHPRHRQQMKPHQIEGFNFLQKNLMTDKPGGCILAHAPGSGKTFMIISFMQSFLARYPQARPLVVLPKGILATWRKEFQRWQVEDIPLYDFYSLKAENRDQQLKVLKTWVDQNGILFLGYKQFSNIVCDNSTSETAAACHKILLKVPKILILDEGHTPRNENTDVLHSLAKVQTPRKVVLSGTLFQNHVKEVFTILNLVRPKFLKFESPRLIVKRILSRVHISGVKKFCKTGKESLFFELVEATLQNDDFKRKVTVIQDLREMTNDVLHYYKGDFLEELPGLVDFTVLLNLTSKQKNAVGKLKNLNKFKGSSVGSAIYMHPQLKQFSEAATAAGRGGNFNDEQIDDLLVKMDVKDGVKTRFFLNLLGLCESAREKLLVFSHYLLPLKFLERLTVTRKHWSHEKEIFMVSGDSTPDHRERAMDRFNTSPDAKVFFGSIKACGEGISLVGASRVLILDVHLNPSVTRQAVGRAFRPGQQKKVYTYRLVAADSPEEDDHLTCFRKELIAKMWFEWNDCCDHQDFEMESVDVRQCGDLFLETPLLGGDVKALYKRS